ncbi:MAG TPA: DUF2892 domain-containing protein [Pseudolabrys sp.]|nr:DUF2892 domain-containing protein [Pseudolabrys sp.]
MTVNLGTIDRVLRIIVGAALLTFAVGIIAPDSGYNWLGWLGAVLIFTAIFAVCPLYSLVGLKTCAAH